MAYDLEQTGQQFENKINRCDMASREKNEAVGKIKRML